MQDRNPHHYIPSRHKKRAELWLKAAEGLVPHDVPFIYMAIENLMFAELPILDLEAKLAHNKGQESQPEEPLLLMECSSLSLLWVCGLYEVTRLLSHSPVRATFSDLHEKLAVLRMPLAKHEVQGKGKEPHHPTSTWCPDTGHVGWSAHNPKTKKMESFFRTELADEFLVLANR